MSGLSTIQHEVRALYGILGGGSRNLFSLNRSNWAGLTFRTRHNVRTPLGRTAVILRQVQRVAGGRHRLPGIGRNFSIARVGPTLAIAGTALALTGSITKLVSALHRQGRKEFRAKVAQRLLTNRVESRKPHSGWSSLTGVSLSAGYRGRMRQVERGPAAWADGYRQGQTGLASMGRSVTKEAATISDEPAMVVQMRGADERSLLDRSEEIAEALRRQLQLGHPVGLEIRQSMQLG